LESERAAAGPLAAACGVKAIPFVVLLGKDGNVDSIHVRGPKLEERLKTLLGEPAEESAEKPVKKPAAKGPAGDDKKDGADPARLSEWADLVSWDALLNRRGTTFRALAEGDKADIDRVKALRLMAARPSLIKRPVAEYPGGLLVGFSEEEWEATLQ